RAVRRHTVLGSRARRGKAFAIFSALDQQHLVGTQKPFFLEIGRKARTCVLDEPHARMQALTLLDHAQERGRLAAMRTQTETAPAEKAENVAERGGSEIDTISPRRDRPRRAR